MAVFFAREVSPLGFDLPGPLKLTASSPENGWLEDEKPGFLLGQKAYFSGRHVSFREGRCL